MRLTSPRLRSAAASVLPVGVLAAAVVAAFLLRDVAPSNEDAAAGAAIGVFATFLTALTIIVALAVDPGSEWPSPWDLLRAAGLWWWLGPGLLSAMTAIVAIVASSDSLAQLALLLTIVGVPLGFRTLASLISVASGRGRHDVVVRLLARSIVSGADFPEFGRTWRLRGVNDHVDDFFARELDFERPADSISIRLFQDELARAIDANDLIAIKARILELDEASRQAIAASDDLAVLSRALDSQIWAFRVLGERLVRQDLDPSIPSQALRRLGAGIVDCAGLGKETSRADDREELAAAELSELVRICGWLAAQADDALVERGDDAGQHVALYEVCVDIQNMVRWAIDPDPPGTPIPEHHPWQRGLSSERAAILWLAAVAGARAGPTGVGIYAVFEILSGEKFTASYWDGVQPIAELHRTLLRDRSRSAPAVEALDEVDGLPMYALELQAVRITGMRRKDTPIPAPLAPFIPADERHLGSAVFEIGAYRPPGRDSLADLAALLSDRSASIWRGMVEERARFGLANAPPVFPVFRRPAACALAVALRETPLWHELADEGEEGLRSFLSKLPSPLLEDLAELIRRFLTGSKAGQPDSGNLEDRLVRGLGLIRSVTPIPPGRPPELDPWPSQLLVPQPPPDFPEAFSELANALSRSAPPRDLHMIQCDVRWLHEWADMRRHIDRLLLQFVLEGKIDSLRRLVLYDIQSDTPDHERANRELLTWHSALQNLFLVNEGDDLDEARCQVRQVVLPRAGNPLAMPEDSVVSGPGFPAFERVWGMVDSGATRGADGFGVVGQGGNLFVPGTPLLPQDEDQSLLIG